MANINLIGRVANLTKTKDEWSSLNPVLLKGEIGYESDTNKCKFGDGTTAWANLAYTAGGSSEGGFSIKELETQLTVTTSSGTTTTDCTTLQDRLYATHVKNLREAFRTAVAAGEITAPSDDWDITSSANVIKYLPENAIYSCKGLLLLYHVPVVYTSTSIDGMGNNPYLAYHNVWTLLTRCDATELSESEEDSMFLQTLQTLSGNFTQLTRYSINSTSLSVQNTNPVIRSQCIGRSYDILPKLITVTQSINESGSGATYTQTTTTIGDLYYQLTGCFYATLADGHYTLTAPTTTGLDKVLDYV